MATNLFLILNKSCNLTNYHVYFKDVDREEYYVNTKEGVRFLDFYIKEFNFAIEFDGSYWHKNKTQADEDHRDNLIKQKIKNIQILHIKEMDYLKNKYEVIKNLIELINERKNNYEQNFRK